MNVEECILSVYDLNKLEQIIKNPSFNLSDARLILFHAIHENCINTIKFLIYHPLTCNKLRLFYGCPNCPFLDICFYYKIDDVKEILENIKEKPTIHNKIEILSELCISENCFLPNDLVIDHLLNVWFKTWDTLYYLNGIQYYHFLVSEQVRFLKKEVIKVKEILNLFINQDLSNYIVSFF